MSNNEANLGHPAGVELRGITGADCDGAFLTVFAFGTDDKIWGRAFWLVSNQWEPWVCIGAPPCGLSSSGNTCGYSVMANRLGAWWIFALGKDGKVWTAIKANLQAAAWLWVESPGSVQGGTIESVWSVEVPSDRLSKPHGPDVAMKMSSPANTWAIASYAPPEFYVNDPAGGWSWRGFFTAPPAGTAWRQSVVETAGFNKARQLVRFELRGGDVVSTAEMF